MTIDEIVKNKAQLISLKKQQFKQADSVSHFVGLVQKDESVVKAESGSVSIEDATQIKAQLVINTTNIMDSHGDVHIPGLWTKSLQESKSPYLLQEHQMKFDKIISDDVKAIAKYIDWSELGFDYNGKTQALVFNSNIYKGRNLFMFEQYANGYVKEHSVGMRYVKLELAVNDERYEEEYKVWKKYIDSIVNREHAESVGYFWAVLEAKMIEGSAVVMGSNRATPTLNIDIKDIGAVTDTPTNEPGNTTQEQPDKAKQFFINLIS